MNFIQYFLIIFIILFQISSEKEIYGARIVDLPYEILKEIVDYTPYPLKTIENFKLVSKEFYCFIFREFFGLWGQTMDRLCFKSTNNFLSYLSLKESEKLKKIFLVFFSNEDQDKVGKIEKFEFIIHPIANEFKQAMLKYLENDPESNLLFKNIIQKLKKPIQCPIEKNFLSICYQHGLGFEKDENEARKLEKKIISDLSNSDQLILPWNFQIWIDPIFLKWFQGLELLTRLQLMQAYLEHPLYAQVEFLKNWVYSKVTKKEIIDFIEERNLSNFYSKLQVCRCYLNILNQINLPLDQFHSIVTFVQNWLQKQRGSFFLQRISTNEKLDFLFLKKIRAYFELLELYKNEDSDDIDLLREGKIILFDEFIDLFNLQSEYFFLEKFKIAQFFFNRDLKENGMILLKFQNFSKIWLKSVKVEGEMIKILTQNFSEVQDFSEKWKDYYSMAVYCIQEKQSLEEVGMKWIQAFFDPQAKIDFYLQLEAAAEWIDRSPNLQITQCIRDWARSEKVKEYLEQWLDQLNQGEEEQVLLLTDEKCSFISQMKWFIQLGYFEQVSHFFSKDLKKLNSQRVLLQLQLAGFCFHLKERKIRQFVIHWLNSEEVQSALKQVLKEDYIWMQSNGREAMELLFFHHL